MNWSKILEKNKFTSDEPIVSLTSGLKFKFNKNLSVLLVCFSLAFLFWLLNVLGKNYVTVVYLPLKYVNFPERKVVLNKLPDKLGVRANVSGYSLLTGSMEINNDTVIINGDHLNERKRAGRKISYISVKSSISEIIAAQYSNYNIQNVLLDTIFIQFDDKLTKVLQVSPCLSIGLANQHVFKKDYEIQPSTIRVSGPKSILDTMTKIYADSLLYKDVSQDFVATLKFELFEDKRFKLVPTNSIVKVSIEKLTEADLDVNLFYENVPENIELKTFPNNVKVTYLVALSKFDHIYSKDFEFYVDYKDIAEGKIKLPVKIKSSPSTISISKLNPDKVEYIAKKK